MPSCFMLFEHCARRPDSRADCTAGSNRPTRTPMIEMTTSSSIKVNPRAGHRREWASKRGLAIDGTPRDSPVEYRKHTAKVSWLRDYSFHTPCWDRLLGSL